MRKYTITSTQQRGEEMLTPDYTTVNIAIEWRQGFSEIWSNGDAAMLAKVYTLCYIPAGYSGEGIRGYA